MKWKISDLNNCIKGKGNNCPSVLIYGQDIGQVDELAGRLSSAIASEPTNVSSYVANEFKDKAEEIYTFATSSSLLGGRRVIVLKDVDDSDGDFVCDLVQKSSLDAFVIVKAYDSLKTKTSGGKLRGLYEDSDRLAVFSCYFDDGNNFATLIKDAFYSYGIKDIENDAINYMISFLGEDRGMTRSYIEKIALFVNDKKKVTLSDVEKCLGDSGNSSTEDFLHFLFSGQIVSMQRILDRIIANNPNCEIELTRKMISHLKQKLLIPISEKVNVYNYVTHNIFWKYEQVYKNELLIWSESELLQMLDKLTALEMNLKTTGIPTKTFFSDFCLKMCLYVLKLSKKQKRS